MRPQRINLNPFIGQQTSGESYHRPADLKGMIRRVSESSVSLKVVVGEKVGRFRVETIPIRDGQSDYDLKGGVRKSRDYKIEKV